ncbi:MAG: hypothetical protein JJ953_08145 [Gracilimonas sp.]|uniref:hypothetical protein n=1 Tax=Gracilimonas TaxID=649462 RepID=UPI001B03E757|nr:hypothetical protein [Gracilimonas sp.]MBO6586057.1 hypothetical protein [Gracilimonas sp.]MBO6614714.1 hypothetical protein [Gracilimonas sp.]
MPLITRLFLKTGLVYFLGALLVGILLQVDALGIPNLVPMFWHMLMVGWITQIIMGVSLWMFPGRIKEESFQNQKWAWLAYGFLNLGLILRFASEPMIVLSEGYHWKILLVISAILQFVAVLCYVIEIWPRVLSKAQRRKKNKSSR